MKTIKIQISSTISSNRRTLPISMLRINPVDKTIISSHDYSAFTYDNLHPPHKTKNLVSLTHFLLMALVNIDTALHDAIRHIQKSPRNGGVEILSYKRNRTVALLRLDEETISVRERGYREEDTEVAMADLSKFLKAVLKREFPRSRKVRFFRFSSPEELHRIRQKI